MTERTGGCACGAVRFKVTGPFMGVGVCHCTDCQKASGGGPNYVALAPNDGFEVTKGEAKIYRSKGDSGGDVFHLVFEHGERDWYEMLDPDGQRIRELEVAN